MGELIPFPVGMIPFPVGMISYPVGMIPFPVLKTIVEPRGTNEKHFVREICDQRPGSGGNNSISCLDNSISCFENQFWTPWIK